MEIPAANVMWVAQSLSAKELLVRERSQRSDREVLARLTPKGQKLFELHFPKAVALMTRYMDERLEEEE